jgi:hypothetical protein
MFYKTVCKYRSYKTKENLCAENLLFVFPMQTPVLTAIYKQSRWNCVRLHITIEIFEALSALVMKRSVFWITDITECSLSKVN